jgi:oligopeptide/dipeptide ABC transporter ATP-binding protein
VTALLSVRDLNVWLDTAHGPLSIVDGVSFDVEAGQVFGLAGESGSGKTITALALLGLLPLGARTGGSAIMAGRDLLAMRSSERRRTRGREIAMVFQDPTSSLHPMLTIERQLTEHLRYQLGLSGKEAHRRAVALLTDVRIPDPEAAMRGYPHQFSGGMRQRAMIAIALACRPKLLLADEPTTALDVTVQDQIIRLVQDLQRELGMSVVWVTHDLGVVAQLCDRVAVMYAGQIVELASVIDLFEESRHPYTRGLLESVPSGERGHGLIPIPGQPPDLLDLLPGCAFAPRCRYATERCTETAPPLRTVKPGHASACLRFEEIWP